jgi:hypothetical protein
VKRSAEEAFLRRFTVTAFKGFAAIITLLPEQPRHKKV